MEALVSLSVVCVIGEDSQQGDVTVFGVRLYPLPASSGPKAAPSAGDADPAPSKLCHQDHHPVRESLTEVDRVYP